MTIFKEYQPNAKICVIRENAYGSNLNKFLSLYEMAKEDFPELKVEDVEIVQYGGRYYVRTFGIEFKIFGKVPDSYDRIGQLEYRC